MKNIKNYKEFNELNESWRQVKSWLKLPQLLLEMLLHKLINFVPRLGLRYDELSAKIDLGHSNTIGYILEEEPVKLTLNDIKNKYGNVNVGLPENANYSLDADLRFCELEFPEDQSILSQRITTNTTKSYKGIVGKGTNPGSKVNVRSEFGNVSLK